MEKVLADVLRKFTEGQETVFDIIEEQDGVKKVVISNPQLVPPEPVRLESPSRSHKFLDVQSLIVFLKRYATENTVVFGSPLDRTFDIVLDAEASNGVEVLQMAITHHPRRTEWRSVLNESTDIKDFAKFLMMCRSDIASPDGLELAYTFSQVRAATNITVEKGVGKRALNGLMAEVVIQGSKKNESVELPDSIEIEIPLFVGSQPTRLNVDLLVDSPEPGHIEVFASCGGLVDAEFQSINDMLSLIAKELPQVVTCLGRANFKEWSYRR